MLCYHLNLEWKLFKGNFLFSNFFSFCFIGTNENVYNPCKKMMH